ncbi:MAG: hypothetical protein P8Y71_27015 [Pseudolabrys sp.]
MSRKSAFLAALLAAIVFSVPAASARGVHKKFDRRLDAVGTAAGAPFTALLFWGHAPVGAPTVLGTIGCAAASPIVATAVLHRPLTYREAHILIGSCLIPIIGGWLVNEAYNKGWLWAPDEKPARRVRYRHHRRHYRHYRR